MSRDYRDGRKGGAYKNWRKRNWCGCFHCQGRQPDNRTMRRVGKQGARFELNEHRMSWWLT